MSQLLPLTEKAIINPILALRATPLNNRGKYLTLSEIANHVLLSEVVSRVIALATSFFAAIDSLAYFTKGVVKGGHLVLKTLGVTSLFPVPTGREVADAFKQSAKFLGITLIGSIAATIWPDVLKYFKEGLSPQGGPSLDWESASDTVKALWQVADKTEEFDKFWGKAGLTDKRDFVTLFDQDTSHKANMAKFDLLDIIYKKTNKTSELAAAFFAPPKQDEKAYYHATPDQKSLERILRTGKIEVCHEKAYRGAWVSTQPELTSGPYILKMHRNIERSSPLSMGFFASENVYWAGFSNDIPVNAQTCTEIFVTRRADISSLEEKCTQWAGHTITVINFFPFPTQYIPREWPGNTPDPVKRAITNTLRIRAQQAENPEAVPTVMQSLTYRIQQLITNLRGGFTQHQQQFAQL